MFCASVIFLNSFISSFNHGYRRRGKTMREKPIRSVRSPLPESFEEDMKKIKEEREKLIQKMSGKCMTAGDFALICQDNKLNTEGKFIKKKNTN